MKHTDTIQKIVLSIMTVCMALFPFVIHKGLIYAGTPIKVFLFFAFAEVLFFIFLWLYIRKKTPALAFHPIVIALGLFIIGMTVSALFGTNINRSFWSMFNRFTGLITWYHIFALVLVLSSTLTKTKLWRTLFITIGLSGGVLALLLMLGHDGFGLFQISPNGGATLRNTTYAGSYVFFTTFFALWGFLQARIRWQKIASVISFILLLINPMFLNYGLFSGEFSLAAGLANPALFVGEARMAAFVTAIGLVTVVCIYYAIKARRAIWRRISAGILAIGIVAVSAGFAFLFIDSPVRDGFVELNGQNRLIYWDMAIRGTMDRPFLGWGPENYAHVLTEHMQPELFQGPSVIEPWADKPHNMPLEILVTSGIWNTVLFLALFAVPILAIRHAVRRKNISATDAAIFGTLVPMYFLNIVVFFFMPTALVLFAIVLAYIAVATTDAVSVPKLTMPAITVGRQRLISAVLLALGITALVSFVFLPWYKSGIILNVAQKKAGDERFAYLSRIIDSSPQSRAYTTRTLSFDLAQGISKQLTAIQNNPGPALLDVAALVPESREILTEVAPHNDKFRWVYTFLLYEQWRIAGDTTTTKQVARAEAHTQAQLLLDQTIHPYAFITSVEVLKDMDPDLARYHLYRGLALYPENEILNSFKADLMLGTATTEH